MINLQLSDNEAFVLLDILDSVGGCPTKSARRFADSMLDKLEVYRNKIFEERCKSINLTTIDYHSIYYVDEEE